MYKYQVDCGGTWETYREVNTLAELVAFAQSDEGRTVCWGRAFRWLAPDGAVVNHLEAVKSVPPHLLGR